MPENNQPRGDLAFLAGPIEQLVAHSRSYPLLTPEQEVDLAKRIERGDLLAKETLINSNLRLVVSVSRRYLGSGVSQPDIVQEGMFGLIRAAEKFDWRKGFRFSTYATLWIRQAIQRGLAESARTIRIPVHVGSRIRKIKEAEDTLARTLERDPTLQEIAEKTKLTMDAVEEVQTLQDTGLLESTVSLDQRVGQNEDSAFGDLFASDDPPPDEVAAETERREVVRRALPTLPERERTVLTLRYGVDGAPSTLAFIGERLNVSIEVARALERRALRTLAEHPEIQALAAA